MKKYTIRKKYEKGNRDTQLGKIEMKGNTKIQTFYSLDPLTVKERE